MATEVTEVRDIECVEIETMTMKVTWRAGTDDLVNFHVTETNMLVLTNSRDEIIATYNAVYWLSIVVTYVEDGEDAAA